MNRILNKEQQALVENNHNLIYEFASKNHLFIDDYYDILAIGLCKAAIIFDPNKGKFSTIAFTCMRNEICMQIRHENTMSSITDEMILSYDSFLKDNDNVESTSNYLDNIFADIHSAEDIVIGNEMFIFLMNLLNKKERQIVQWLVDGKKIVEIAELLCYTRSNIYLYIGKIRQKWATCLNDC